MLYEKPQLEIVQFSVQDVIRTSPPIGTEQGGAGDDYDFGSN